MNEWKKVKLGEIISISSGFSYKSDYLGEGDNLLLGMGCVSYKDSFVDSGARPYSQDCDEKYLVKPGDIVLATRQQSNNLPILAMPAVIPQKYAGKKLIVGANLYKVENHSNIDNRFIYYLLKGYDYVGYINGVKTGANVQMVSKRNVEAYSFLCPPLETCNRIATILSRYDSLIENYQKQIKLLEEAAQRLYKEWFIDLHFPRHENTNIIDGVPEGWEKKSVGELAEIKSGYAFKSKDWQTSGCPVVKIKDIDGTFVSCNSLDCVSQDITKKASNYLLAKGDIVIAMTGATIGKIGLTTQEGLYTNQRVGKFFIKKDVMMPFLYCFFKNQSTTEMVIKISSSSSAQPNISGKQLTDFTFIANEEILVSFGNKTMFYFKQMIELQSQLRLLTEARDRLLPKLMSGEIDV